MFRSLLAFLLAFCTITASASISVSSQYRFAGGVYYYGTEIFGAWSPAPDITACQSALTAYKAAAPSQWVYTSPSVSGSGTSSVCSFTFATCSTGCSYLPQNLGAQSQGGYCPPNSTLSGSSCTCNAGYVEQGSQCVQQLASCTPGSSVSSGYFDGGTSLSGGPRAAACTGGCLVVFDGSFPSGSALVDGVKHYYAKGSYVKTGFQCDSGAGVGIDGGDGNMPASSASVPSDTCADGQAQGTVNGKTVCVNQETGNVVPSTSANQTTSTSSTSTVTNPDGSRTDTTTTTTTAVDGTSTTTTTTTNYRPDGSVSGSTSQSSGTGVDEEAEDDIPGSNDASGFYEKKDLSVASIFGEARDALAASPIGSSVTGFFNISGGGSCPSMTWDVPLFNASAAVDTFCSQGAANMYLVIRGVVLLIAGLMAFRIAIDF